MVLHEMDLLMVHVEDIKARHDVDLLVVHVGDLLELQEEEKEIMEFYEGNIMTLHEVDLLLVHVEDIF